MSDQTKIYQFWNGKNIDGKSYVGDRDLIEKVDQSTATSMKYEIGVDTFSANDLQPGIDYED